MKNCAPKFKSIVNPIKEEVQECLPIEELTTKEESMVVTEDESNFEVDYLHVKNPNGVPL